jgi:hypothetical protein
VDSAALGAQVPEGPAAQVPEEPAAPVGARLLLVRPLPLADLLLLLAVPVPARLAVLVQVPAPGPPLLAERLVLAHLAAGRAELLLSRQSFSAAMARTTP